jgi:CHAT domain-containing protein
LRYDGRHIRFQLQESRRVAVALLVLSLVLGVPGSRYAAAGPSAQVQPDDASRAVALVEQAARDARGTREDRQRALEGLSAAISLADQARARRTEAEAHDLRGQILYGLGGAEQQALQHHLQAREIYGSLDDLSREASALSNAGLVLRRLGRVDEALAIHREALGLYRRANDRNGEGRAHHNIAAALSAVGRLNEALVEYDLAIALKRETGDTTQGVTLSNLATVHAQLGDMERAIALLNEGLEKRREAADRPGEAYTRLSLGSYLHRLGDTQTAVDHLTTAAAVFQDVGDRTGLGFAWHTLGQVHFDLGHTEDAITLLDRALPLREGDPARTATTLQVLGSSYHERGEADRARNALERALELKRTSGDRVGEAAVLRTLARIELERGQQARAAERAEEARVLAERLGNPEGIAWALVLLGRGAEDSAASIAHLDAAIELAQRIVEPAVEADARTERARRLRDAGRLQEALADLDRAFVIVEQRRASVASLDLRSAYLQKERVRYELLVDVLLRLHARAPEAGHAIAAFDAAERGRARGLLDAFEHAFTPAPAEASARRDEAALERGVNGAAARLQAARQRKAPPDQIDALDADLRQRLLALRLFRAEHRTRLPWRLPSEVATVDDIRRTRLTPDTSILAFWLGDERSVAWVVTPTAVHVANLPARRELVRAVADAHDALDGGREDVPGRALDTLARLLLRPVAPWFRGSQLLVVGDGVTHFAPLAALAATEGGSPLASSFDITWLPSLSVAARAWPEGSGRALLHGRVAIFADPVYDARDPRVARTGAPPDEPAPWPIGGSEFGRRSEGPPARLRFTRSEAAGIVEVATAPSVALDFDASKAALTALSLQEYAVLHLATHATVDPRYPELSGLALSLVDRNGRAVDGRLRLHEVVRLGLSGQLVVLSACSTVTGAEIDGGGVQGLARAFVQAGAGAVLASQWDVDDRATAVLMSHLYRALLRERLAPAAALRQAQTRMLGDPRWRDPRHWAGFVLIGGAR